MTAGARPRAVIVVDLNAQNGVCSNCNQTALLVPAHICGAEIIGVAINVEYVAQPSFQQGITVNSKLPRGMAFVGAGRVVSTTDGYRFERTHNPGDMH